MKDEGFTNLVIVDKHPANVAVLRKLHPELTVIEADMSTPGAWQGSFAGANAAVMLQAQIGGEDEGDEDGFAASVIVGGEAGQAIASVD